MDMGKDADEENVRIMFTILNALVLLVSLVGVGLVTVANCRLKRQSSKKPSVRNRKATLEMVTLSQSFHEDTQ